MKHSDCINTIIISLITLGMITLSGCANNSNRMNSYSPPATSDNLVAAPSAVAVYPYHIEVYDQSHMPKQKFTSIGKINVSKVNEAGLMRQLATIKTVLREQAIKMDGDAVILLPSTNPDSYCAEVIKYTPNHTPDNLAKNN